MRHEGLSLNEIGPSRDGVLDAARGRRAGLPNLTLNIEREHGQAVVSGVAHGCTASSMAVATALPAVACISVCASMPCCKAIEASTAAVSACCCKLLPALLTVRNTSASRPSAN